ncbi:MAG: peptidoglycan-binding protein [Xanthobacteraceae bacterium]
MKTCGATLLVLAGLVALWQDAETQVQAQMQLPPQAVRRQARPASRYRTVRPARPRAGAPPAVYARMPEEERIALQSDLIWTNDYNGMANGDFGKGSVAAVKSFQRRIGGQETGILNPDERARLAQSAKTRQQRVGWQMIDDDATGARLGLPLKLVPQKGPGKTGTHWQSRHGEIQIDTFRVAGNGVTLAKVFAQQKRQPRQRRVRYQVKRDDFFVLSGLQNLKKFYVRAQAKDNEVRGVTVLYDQAIDGTMDPVAVAMSNAFQAFPDNGTDDPISRKVVYASGIVVSAAGDIVTDARVTQACEFILVPGRGRAEKRGEGGGLALLRVYGARGLTPLRVPAGAANGAGAETVTLVGVADPQTQGGSDAVTTATARLTSGADGFAITPAPEPGFPGAAAVDSEGDLVGMVTASRPQRVAGPAASGGAHLIAGDVILALLGKHGVAAAGTRAGIEAAKAAVVRVICVRE